MDSGFSDSLPQLKEVPFDIDKYKAGAYIIRYGTNRRTNLFRYQAAIPHALYSIRWVE